MDEDILAQLLMQNRRLGVYTGPADNWNPTGRYPTMLQQDLYRRGTPLIGKDAYIAGNRSNPQEYVGLPEDPDDIFGY